MRLLVKIGGTLLDSASQRQSLARQLAQVSQGEHQCVVVHGGGKQITRFLEERGIQSRFVNGLRVTTPETMDAVLKVLAGSVNQELVASLIREGALAVGLTGLDAGLVEATQLDPELGAVGKVIGSHPDLLNLLVEQHYLPVVACLAGDKKGNFYNVNGDQMAVACAAGFQAQRLLFLTDVAGVLDGAGKRLPSLTPGSARKLIESGVAKGGMEAKLNASFAALEGGVASVSVVPGAEENVILRVLAGEQIGTEMLPEREES